MPAPGLVTLVGAGPGDPALLTRGGAEALGRAEVVVYDHLVHPRLLDLAPGASLIFAGKQAGRCALPQDQINALLIEHARAGRRVVRLKGGDPYVFGRGAEEAEALYAADVPFRVIPGVTAAVGASAYAGLAITHRDAASAVAFVTGHGDPATDGRVDWRALAAFPGTIVVYMGTARLAAICATLQAHGLDGATPSALVCRGTMPSQRVVQGTLAELAGLVAEAGVGAPGLLVVGRVVGRRGPLSWFERLPLFGRRVVLTRPDGDEAARSIEELGGEALLAPMVQIRPAEDQGPMDRAIGSISSNGWLVFTSPNGVRHFLSRLLELGHDLRSLGGVKLAAIGPSTAEALAAYHLRADLVPSTYRSESLAEVLAPLVVGKKVLLARADRGSSTLPDALGKVAEVQQVVVYRNVDAEAIPEAVARRLAEGSVDWVTLTSPAIASRFLDLMPVSSSPPRFACLSEAIAGVVRARGFDVQAVAVEATWAGLLACLK